MTISAKTRLLVRQRANFSCEYCAVAEVDSGGELTIDHFHPQTRAGSDDIDNLLYCCQRCNQYKADYWPNSSGDPVLWNPRQEPAANHLLHLANGTVYPLTDMARFTIQRLRLNRPPLIAYRLRHSIRTEEERLLTRYRELIVVLERLYEQQAVLLEEQRTLIEQQRSVLNALLKRAD
jgi:hypothetical protein